MRYILILVILSFTTMVSAGEQAVELKIGFDVGLSPKIDFIGYKSKAYELKGSKRIVLGIEKWCIDGYVWYVSNGDISQAYRNTNNSPEQYLLRCLNDK